MRLEHLEIEGLFAFRERTNVDFSEVDLFALSGETGAGKSSLFDAITLALYGGVYRYDDLRFIAPAVSSNMSRGRVSFTFGLSGKRYRATRVVKLNSKGGASTPEARLEEVDENGESVRTLTGDAGKGDANDVTAMVTELTGLTFEDFCRVVILPQNKFQEFLVAKPKERRDLLFRLLKLDVIDELASLAREDNGAAKSHVEFLEQQMSALEGIDGDTLKVAETNVEKFEELLETVTALNEELEQRQQRGQEARNEEQEAKTKLDAIGQLAETPQGLEDVATMSEQLDTKIVDAKKVYGNAEEAYVSQQKKCAAFPERSALQQLLDLFEKQTQDDSKLEQIGEQLDGLRDNLSVVVQERQQVNETLESKKRHLEQLQQANLAASVAAHVEDGSTCPVCFQSVGFKPEHDDVVEHIADAEQDLADTEKAFEDAKNACLEVERQIGTLEVQQQSLTANVSSYSEQAQKVADQFDTKVELTETAVKETLERLRAEQAQLSVLEREQQNAKSEVDKLERQKSDASDDLENMWEKLSELRDKVSTLSPPSLSRADGLAHTWETLSVWADERYNEVEKAKTAADIAITQAMSDYQDTSRKIKNLLVQHGVQTKQDEKPRESVLLALTLEKGEVELIEGKLEQKRQLKTDLDAAHKKQQLAAALVKHLDSRNFPTWVGNKLLKALTESASNILKSMTNERYSIRVTEKGTFNIIDHADADAVRISQTLSGGETFIASLAMALALAEHIMSRTAGASSRIEALLLDEGFGSLSPAALETVTDALEGLGDDGRQVGIITHIRSVSERMPVQYNVTSNGRTSQVTRQM